MNTRTGLLLIDGIHFIWFWKSLFSTMVLIICDFSTQFDLVLLLWLYSQLNSRVESISNPIHLIFLQKLKPNDQCHRNARNTSPLIVEIRIKKYQAKLSEQIKRNTKQ